jgi:predicted transposase YbfD/YdcC
MLGHVFIESFSELKDPRRDHAKKHLLLDIIALTLIATMSGAQCYAEIELFGEIHEKYLSKYLSLPNGIPSHDTINRVMSILNPEQFNVCFMTWIKQIKEITEDNIIAIDGKTLRGSHERSNSIKAHHILNAYSCVNGLTLGQIKVEDKSNEITAIPELLKILAIENSIVTLDAMGCQKDIAEQIINSKADYVLAVKGNQKSLFEPVKDLFALSRNNRFNRNLNPSLYKHEIMCEHGKIEDRKVRAFSVRLIADQTNMAAWSGIKSIIEIEHINYSSGDTEYRYYISSICSTKIETIATAIRSHWNIENNLHWVLDMVFKEDDCRIRDEIAAQNMSWVRKMAAFFLKQDQTKMSMRRKMLKYWAKPQNAIALIKEK